MTKTFIIAKVLKFVGTFAFMQEKRKLELLKRWKESRNLPRKMKKKTRKELEIHWQIANIDILNYLNY